MEKQAVGFRSYHWETAENDDDDDWGTMKGGDSL
jgi:hypothetical protein